MSILFISWVYWNKREKREQPKICEEEKVRKITKKCHKFPSKSVGTHSKKSQRLIMGHTSEDLQAILAFITQSVLCTEFLVCTMKNQCCTSWVWAQNSRDRASTNFKVFLQCNRVVQNRKGGIEIEVVFCAWFSRETKHLLMCTCRIVYEISVGFGTKLEEQSAHVFQGKIQSGNNKISLK